MIGEHLLNCPGPYKGTTIIISYAPPFSETPGGCGGEAVETQEDIGVFTFLVRNSWEDALTKKAT